MKKIFIRTLTLLLAVMLLVGCVGCQNRLGKPLMTLKKSGTKVSLSVNIYELMLTRMKGVLYISGTTNQGLDVASPLFWDYQDTFDGTNLQTIDEFYCNMVLENCRDYLAMLYLFETNVGELSAADEKKLDALMEELITTDGDGSKTKLNAVLAAYGVNYEILREAYALDYKKQAVTNALYGENASKLGYNIKESFLRDNYVHFRQIFLSTEKVVYRTDEFGDDVYYYSDESDKKGRICYDVHNGVKGTNEDGTDLLDKNGDVIYYVAGSEGKKIAYNTKEGEREPIFNGSAIKTVAMTAEEKAKVVEQKDALLASLQSSTNEQFEKAIVDYLREEDPKAEISEFDDGIYLPKQMSISTETETLAMISEEVAKAEIGQVIAIETAQGWHIIKRYEHTEKAYEKEENEAYFADFVSALTEQLLLEECAKYHADITINEKVLANAPTMRDVAINGKYTYY